MYQIYVNFSHNKLGERELAYGLFKGIYVAPVLNAINGNSWIFLKLSTHVSLIDSTSIFFFFFLPKKNYFYFKEVGEVGKIKEALKV